MQFAVAKSRLGLGPAKFLFLLMPPKEGQTKFTLVPPSLWACDLVCVDVCAYVSLW